MVIGQSPRCDRSVQDISNEYYIHGESASEESISVDLHAINSKLREIAGIESFVDPSAFFCDKQDCRFKGAEGFYFWDNGHLTAYGSRQASEYIFSKIKI
jgi:hypothetical protein